jgi:hypothetical protein
MTLSSAPEDSDLYCLSSALLWHFHIVRALCVGAAPAVQRSNPTMAFDALANQQFMRISSHNANQVPMSQHPYGLPKTVIASTS